MKALVTGGAGFVGSHLTEYLLEKGYEVTVLDDFSFGSEQNLKNALTHDKLKVVQGTVMNPELMKKLIKGVDIVFHLAAIVHVDYSISHPRDVFEINVLGTLNVLEAARVNEVRKFIYASSSEVYGSARYVPEDEEHPLNPASPYAASKTAADRLCTSYFLTYGLPVAIIRNFNTFGPRQRYKGYSALIPTFIYRVANGLPPIIYGDGDQTRDYQYIRDSVKGYYLVAETDGLEGEIINFGTGREISINKIAKLVLDALNSDLEPIHTTPRPGEVKRLCADISKAKRLVGFKPETPFKDGLLDLVEWMTKNA